MAGASTPAVSGAFEFEALRFARQYRQALLRDFSPFLKGRVVEIGAGIGQFTELLITVPGVQVLAVEPDAAFCRELSARLPGHPFLQGTAADLDAAFEAGAVVSVNVLEHIQEDAMELKVYRNLLSKRRGTLCLFVPARKELYAPIDRDFGHFRRYTKPELAMKLHASGFELLRLDYFNFAGYFAWWFNFRLLRKRHFSEPAVRLFDKLIFPIVHAFESKILRPPVGQSLLALAHPAADRS